MKVFKNKWFCRWARAEKISDAVLRRAAAEIAAGKYDADLGGFLFKKRLARPGQGKSGGYRTIVGIRKHGSDRLIFLYAFAKNAKANITDKEEAALSLIAESFLLASDQQVNLLLKSGTIVEVGNNE